MSEVGKNYLPNVDDEIWGDLKKKTKKFDDIFFLFRESHNLKEQRVLAKSLVDKIKAGVIDHQKMVGLLAKSDCTEEEIKNWENGDRSIEGWVRLIKPEISQIDLDVEILAPGKDEEKVVEGQRAEKRNKLEFNKIKVLLNIFEDINSSIVEINAEGDREGRESSGYRVFVLDDISKIIMMSDLFGKATVVIHDVKNVDDQEVLKSILSLNRTDLLKSNLDVQRIDYEEENKENWEKRIRGALERPVSNQAIELDTNIVGGELPAYHLADRFLARLSDEELLGGIEGNYRHFLDQNKITERSYQKNSFVQRVNKERDKRDLKVEGSRKVDSEIIEKVEFFLDNLTDEELIKMKNRELYDLLLHTFGIAEEQYGVSIFLKKVKDERKTRGVSSENLIPVDETMVKEVKSFLKFLTDSVLISTLERGKRGRIEALYQRFLDERGYEKVDIKYRSFYDLLKKESKRRELEYEESRNAKIASKAKIYIANLEDSRLTGEGLSRGLYDDFMSTEKQEQGKEDLTYSKRSFEAYLNLERRKRGLKSDAFFDQKAVENAIDFFKKSFAKEVKKSYRELYNLFLQSFGYTNKDYSLNSFKKIATKLHGEIESLSGEKSRKEILLQARVFFSNLSNDQLSSITGRRLYDLFLTQTDVKESEYGQEIFNSLAHVKRKARGIKLKK